MAGDPIEVTGLYEGGYVYNDGRLTAIHPEKVGLNGKVLKPKEFKERIEDWQAGLDMIKNFKNAKKNLSGQPEKD